ncbi:MAG: O-antigen ligase family protein [Planctomycetota bacterium]
MTERTGRMTQRIATLGVIVLALTKAAVQNERTPVWDFDAWSRWSPMTGLGPATGVAIDALILALSAFGLWGVVARGRSVRVLWVALGLVGALGVWLHAALSGPGWIEPLAPEGGGSTWISGIAALIVCAHASRDRWLARVGLGLALGFIGVLLTKGLIQIWIEHPLTVRAFRIDREGILAARGWSEGSPAALSFERRLLQPEATGWFGLANVYASFAAATAIGLGAAAAAWVRTDRAAWKDRAWLIVLAGAGAGVLALFFSGSKGGLGAALLAGLGVVAMGVLTGRRRKLARWVGPALITSVLAGVVARGFVGTNVDELSLLFRAFYMEGALRIWASAPFIGVGPGGFQDAYLLAKPPVSPEAVASPHSVAFDWTSTLGLFGLAWAVLLGLASTSISPARCPRTDPEREVLGWKPIALLCGVAVLAGAFAERFATTPELALGRIAGLALWAFLAWAVMNRTPTGALRLAGVGASLTILVHSQIEMTSTQPESAVLALSLVGLGVGPRVSKRRRGRLALALSGGVLVLAFAAAPVVLTLARWQGALLDAASAVRPIAEATTQELRVETSDAVLMLSEARADLERASGWRPAHEPTLKAAGRTSGVIAASTGDIEVLTRSAERAARLADGNPTASTHGWAGVAALAVVDASRAAGETPQEAGQWLGRAIDHFRAAAALDPHGVVPALRVMDAFEAAEKPDLAKDWAAETLRRDGLTTLDPLVGLGERDRRRVEALAGAI